MIVQTFFVEKIKVEGSVTFQNIFSSMADFRDVVSVMSYSPTNKGKKNLCGCAEKANRQSAFVAFWLSSYVEPATLKQRLRLQIDLHQNFTSIYTREELSD